MAIYARCELLMRLSIIIRYAPRTVGLMKIKNINRYSPLARGAEALGYGMRSPPAWAGADYLFKDHTPSVMRGRSSACAGESGVITQQPSIVPGAMSSAINNHMSDCSATNSIIKLRDATFTYAGASRPALRAVTLAVPAVRSVQSSAKRGRAKARSARCVPGLCRTFFGDGSAVM
jgi:hypothetical protein